jgi:quinolinate synthase
MVRRPRTVIFLRDGGPERYLERSPMTSQQASSLVARLRPVLPEAEVIDSLVLIEEILDLKARRNAVVVAHNYQVPLITAGIADFTADSLAMARYGARADAEVIVVCGVHFMGETAKLLSPGRTVLLPAPDAGCSLADSVTAESVRALRARYPGVPAVAYVNTTAAVKAEVDICCTSANAVDVVRSLASPRVILLPDRYLAGYVAARVDCEVIRWAGSCDVHERFTPADFAHLQGTGVHILAHPECPPDVQQAADFVGSTGAMIDYLREARPQRALLLTECSMADNVSVTQPGITFERPCNLCPRMKQVTLEKVRDALLGAPGHEVFIDPAVAERARLPLERMLAL